MASIFLDLADLLSSSSEEESVSGGDFSSSDRPLRILVGMSTPSPLTRGTSRSTSASAEVLRKRFDGWWCIMCSLESVSPCFMLPFVVADDSDFVGGTPVKMTSARMVSLGRHIASEVESTAVDPILSS